MKARIIITFIILISVAALPWLFSIMFAPLVPPVFAETLTAYYPTEWARSTREAAEEFQATSVFVTLPPDPAFNDNGVIPVNSIVMFTSGHRYKNVGNNTFYKYATTVPFNVSPEPTVVESIEATPTIPLPVVRTATPEPPIIVLVSLTNEQIADLARDGLSGLTSVMVDITPERATITGQVGVLGPLTQEIKIQGALIVINEKIAMNVQSVERNGVDVTNNEDGQIAGGLINNWLLDLQFGQRVQQLIVGEGQIVYLAVQSKDLQARVPYAVVNIAATAFPAATNTLIPTATLPEEPALSQTAPSQTVEPSPQSMPTINTDRAGQVLPVTPRPTYPVFTITPSPLPPPTSTLAPNQPSPTLTPSIEPPIARYSTAVIPAITYSDSTGSIGKSVIGVISGSGTTFSFTADGGMIFRGNLQSLSPLISVPSIESGEVEVEMRLEIRDGRPVPVVEAVKLNGTNLSEAVFGELQNIMGDWWAGASNQFYRFFR